MIDDDNLTTCRLNMSSSSQGTPGQYRSTPLSCDSSGSGRKRRIVETEEHETSSTSITHQNLSSMYSEYFSDGHGGVEIYQVDVNGKYIKLYNGSDKVHSSLNFFLKIYVIHRRSMQSSLSNVLAFSIRVHSHATKFLIVLFTFCLIIINSISFCLGHICRWVDRETVWRCTRGRL